MSDYQGNIVIKNPATPTGPSTFGRAPGMWKLSEVAYWIKQGVWPNPAIVPDLNFPNVSLLLSTTSLGNANNNLFVDSSGAFNPISRNGNTTQGSFTPYSANWSNFFDASGDYERIASSQAALQFGTGAFTIEGWVYSSGATGTYQHIITGGSSWTSGSGGVYWYYNGGAPYLGAAWNGFAAPIQSGTLAINTWHHFALVRVSNTLTLYINGSSVSTLDVTGYNLAVNNQSQTNIGGGGWDQDFGGYLSNLRVIKGTALYTGNFTVPTSPLTAISGTSLLTCQSNRFRDASSNNFTLTVAGDTRVTDFSPFSPAYPGAAYNQSDITNWSGFFNGGTDRVQVPVTSNMYLGTTYTIEAWAYYNSTSYGARPIFSECEAFQGGFAGLTLTLNTSGNLVAEYRPATSGAVTTITGPTVTPYTWFHIALVSDNSSAKLYVNGTQVGSTTTFGDYPSAKTAFVAVGSWGHGWNDGGIPAAAWIGYISNMRVVKGVAVYTSNFTPSTTPLTAVSGTVLLTCQNAAFSDNSSVNNILTPVSGATVTGNSPFNTVGYWSNYFDGTSDWLATPSDAAFGFGTGDFTIECWAYPTSTKSNMRLWQFGGDSDNVDISSGGSTGAISYYNGSTSTVSSSGVITFNAWNHVACVRSSGTVRIYVNGVLQVTQATTPNSSTRILYIAGQPNNWFEGYISNFRVVKGTAVYTSAFTPPTSPLTSISGTSLLTCQNGRFIDNSTNNFTITRNGDVSVQSFDPFYTATVASNGGSLYLDGSGDYLTSPTSPAYDFRSSNFTIEGWFYFTNSTANALQTLYTNYTSFSSAGSIFFGKHTNNSGYVTVWFSSYSTGGPLLAETTYPPNNAWTHYAVVRNGNTFTLYRNGVATATASWSGAATSGSNAIWVGAAGDAVTAYNFPGYMSDFRITKSAVYTAAFTPPTAPLTPSANTTLLLNGMNAGIYDATTINDMETVGNAQVRYPSPFAPANYYAGSFDGAGDYLTVSPTALSTGDFTFECWIYPTSTGQYQYFYDTRTSVNDAAGFCVIYNHASYPNQISIYSNGFIGTPTITVSANTWTHFALVRSGGSWRTFVNGFADISPTSVSRTLSNTALKIGAGQALDYFFVGSLSNYRIVNGTAVYTAAFTPPTSPLTAISGTSLLTCQNKTFIDNSTNAFTITANGNATAGAFGPFTATGGTSMYFGGLNNWLDFPANPTADFGTGDITIECWLYVTSTATSYQSICQFGNAAVTSGFHILTNNNTICLRTNNSQPLTTSGTFTANTWNHIALTRASGTTRIFINGTTSGGTYNWTASLSSGSTRRIGGDIYSNALTGYIDDFRVTRGVARYTSNFTPPTQAFPTY